MQDIFLFIVARSNTAIHHHAQIADVDIERLSQTTLFGLDIN